LRRGSRRVGLRLGSWIGSRAMAEADPRPSGPSRPRGASRPCLA
jgi:hypothetical protein